MDKFRVQGPTKLQGEVTISGAKNAALPILFAALLAEEPVEIQNVPKLKDVDTSMKLLSQLGAKVERNGSVHIDARDVNVFCAPYDLVKTMRASIWALGPLVARFGQGQVSLPGGCTIGARPVDLHISGLEQLGATIKLEEGYVKASVDGRLKGAHIVMDKVSVGATVTIMCAATLAEGTTIIENSAKEPHVVDLANFLNSMGANIKGAGTDVIRIKGVSHLHGTEYAVIPDQIEAGTFMFAAAVTKGDVTVKNVIPKHLESITAKLLEIGCEVEEADDCIRVVASKPLQHTQVKTLPYPGFPTDMQPQLVTFLTTIEGTSMAREGVWDNRFRYVNELKRMGADIRVEGKLAISDGVNSLIGAHVKATDLRAGAAMIIAGLMAEGTTEITDIYHIDRGYENFEEKFVKLGGSIERVQVVDDLLD